MMKVFILYKQYNKLYNIIASFTMTIRKLVGTLENKGPYIDQSTGHWFYWNGTKYVDSGYPYAIKPVFQFKIENGILYYAISWEVE